MPHKQGFGRGDAGDFGQSASAHFLGADGKSAALIVGEAEASNSELFAKDSILFSQVVDSVLVMLAEPASKAGDEESERIQLCGHPESLSNA